MGTIVNESPKNWQTAQAQAAPIVQAGWNQSLVSSVGLGFAFNKLLYLSAPNRYCLFKPTWRFKCLV